MYLFDMGWDIENERFKMGWLGSWSEAAILRNCPQCVDRGELLFLRVGILNLDVLPETSLSSLHNPTLTSRKPLNINRRDRIQCGSLVAWRLGHQNVIEGVSSKGSMWRIRAKIDK